MDSVPYSNITLGSTSVSSTIKRVLGFDLDGTSASLFSFDSSILNQVPKTISVSTLVGSSSFFTPTYLKVDAMGSTVFQDKIFSNEISYSDNTIPPQALNVNSLANITYLRIPANTRIPVQS